MSQWKLVEAEAVGDQTNNFNNQNKQINKNNQNNNRGNNKRNDNNRGNNNRRNTNGNKNRNQRGNRRQHDIYVPDTPETRQQYAAMAVQLLEYYFSDDSLSCDTFVRSYLDSAGYIPIAFVCNFPDVVAIGAYYEDILSQLQKSEIFEMDMENETIRVKGWEKWLMPNQEGGFGLPRYIKNAPNEQQGQMQSVVSQVEPPVESMQSRDRSGSKELSVNASEYVFNIPTNK